MHLARLLLQALLLPLLALMLPLIFAVAWLREVIGDWSEGHRAALRSPALRVVRVPERRS